MRTGILDMTEGRPLKLLLVFSVPLVLGNLFQQMYTFTDTLIVSRRLGADALAALGAVEWICFLMFGLIQGMTQGFSVVIARLFGAKNIEGVRVAIRKSLGLSIAGAVLFLAAGQAGLRFMLFLLNTPEEILGMSEQYMRILFLGIPVSFAFNMISAILRALGNSTQPVRAMILSSAANIILDILFVMRFGWGIAGAAWATVIAQISAALYGGIYLYHVL